MKTKAIRPGGVERSPAQQGMDPLVRRAREGDHRAFGELFERNVKWVYAMLYRTFGARTDLEDLVQEVFIRAHRSLPTFRGQAKFETWLRRICARVAYDEMRKARSRPRLELVAETPEQSVSVDVERREAVRQLLRIIRDLPAKNRIVLLLHDVEGYTSEEIRLVVGARSVGTVKSRLRLAREELHRRAGASPALSWLYGGGGR